MKSCFLELIVKVYIGSVDQNSEDIPIDDVDELEEDAEDNMEGENEKV